MDRRSRYPLRPSGRALAGLVGALLWLCASACGTDRTAAAVAETGGDPDGYLSAGLEPPLVVELPILHLPMTVEEAYAAIPHRRTVFHFESSSLSAAEARYLAAVFHLLDQGTRIRVVAMMDLQADGTTEHAPARSLVELHDRVATFSVPSGLEEYHALILEALARERAVFEAWEAAGSTYEHSRSIGRAPDVRAASQALRDAYGILKRRYGASESTANADALFDYHCALDFL